MEHPTRGRSRFSRESVRTRRKKVLASVLSLFVLLVGMPTLLLGAGPATADVSIVVDGTLEPAYGTNVATVSYAQDTGGAFDGQLAVIETDEAYYLGFQQAFTQKSNVYCEKPNARDGCHQNFKHIVSSDYISFELDLDGRTVFVPIDVLRSDPSSSSGYASFVGGGDGGNLSGIDASAVEGASAMDHNLNVHGWSDLATSPNFSSTPDHPYIYPAVVEVGLDKAAGNLPDGLDWHSALIDVHNSPEAEVDIPRHASMSCLADQVVGIGQTAIVPVTTFEGVLPKVGQDVVALLTGDGSIVSVGGTPGNAGQTDASGVADIVVTSSTGGTTSVKAFWDLDGDGTWDPATEPVTEPACPVDWTFEPEARISITPDATNEVGDDHAFTVRVAENDGTGWADAAGEDVTAVIDSGPGTLTTPTCTTDADGACQVVLHSDDTGVTVVSAASDVDVAGTILPRTTNGQDGNSGPATKTWVDLKIEVSPLTATNEVNDEHVVTVTVSQDDGSGSGWAAVPGGTTVDFSLHNNSAGASFVGADDCTTAAGTCRVTINTSSPGDVDIRATATVSVGGVSMTRTTGTGGNNSPDANKVYVDARIAISPDGVNAVGDDHLFTVHVEENDGTGWADAAGETVNASISNAGPGTLSPTSCDTDGNGKCTVTLSSGTTGTTVVSATSDVSVGGLSLTRTTDGQNGSSGPATKEWVDAGISITPDGTNEVGDAHDFTITVVADPSGAGAPSFDSITTSVDPTPDSATDDCDTLAISGNTATCTLTINNATPGNFTANATAEMTIGTETLSLTTDPAQGGSGSAVKTYVDAKIELREDGVNEVGDPHTFTATVSQDDGSGTWDAVPDGTRVDFSLVNNTAGATFTGNDFCVTAGSECDVTINSSSSGSVDVQATSTVDVGGVSMTRATNSGGNNSPDGNKVYVDARIAISPDGVNRVGDDHTFSVHVEENEGSGWADAAGEDVTADIDSGPGTLTTARCITDADGTCEVILSSDDTGTTVVSAASDVSVSGLALTRSTDGTGGNSGPATKHWVDALITINPPEAANQVGDPHDFTITVFEVTGGGADRGEGVLVTTSILDGPGAFVNGQNTCTTDANGECTVTIESTQTGLTIVQAAATVGVDEVDVPLVTDGVGANAAPATKRWVDARLSITPEADANRVDDPHTFTALLELDLGDGQGFGTAPAGEPIAFDKVSGPGALEPTSCTTDDTGSCSVALESGETGLTRVNAAWTGTIATAEGQADAATSSNEAIKRWVDARITVTPEQATNVAGDTHTFTALLTHDLGDSAGFVAAADETIAWAIGSGPGTLSTETCTTDADGTCTTDLDSAESGTTAVSAAWSGDIATAEGIVSTTVSDDATKDWVTPAIEIVKTAAPELGPPRDVTYSYLVTNIGDVTLTNVDVTDDVLGLIGTIDVLEPGQSTTLETTVAVDETSPVVNVGTACGDPTVDGEVIGDEVCDDDDATITVVLGESIVRPQALPRTGTDLHVATTIAALLVWLGSAAYLAEDRFGWIRGRRARGLTT